jgi:hypothetical protein
MKVGSGELKDTLENKSEIYGPFENQLKSIGMIMKALDDLRKGVNGGTGLSYTEIAGYQFIAQKLARTVTARGESSTDSWVDLMNYADKMGEMQTGNRPSLQLINVFYPEAKEALNSLAKEIERDKDIAKADLSDIILKDRP